MGSHPSRWNAAIVRTFRRFVVTERAENVVVGKQSRTPEQLRAMVQIHSTRHWPEKARSLSLTQSLRR